MLTSLNPLSQFQIRILFHKNKKKNITINIKIKNINMSLRCFVITLDIFRISFLALLSIFIIKI